LSLMTKFIKHKFFIFKRYNTLSNPP
jgi:hypothetical protein